MIELYPYQEDAIRKLNRAFRTGTRRTFMVMASGLGKTIISAMWAKQYISRYKGLFLCHNNDILEQARNEYKKVFDSKTALGLFNGKQKDADPIDMLFASFQTMRNWKSTLRSDKFHFVIVDESHHGQAPTFKEVIRYFTPRYLLGMTATPDRMDTRDIRNIFGREVVNVSLEYAIGQGWLTPIEYHLITDNLDLDSLKRLVEDAEIGGRRITMEQLNETIFVRARDERIAEIISDHNKKTIIFCQSIAHVNYFQQFLPGAEPYHSNLKLQTSKDILTGFREGRIQYLLVVDKFNEGLDIPDAELIVFLRCTDSRTIFLQQLGRGLRKQRGKERVVILDFVGNVHRVVMIRDFVLAIKGTKISPDMLYVAGQGFHFEFAKEQLDIFAAIERMRLRYVSDIPHLLTEYSDKNPLPPEQVVAGTNQKLLWICSTCSYEWHAQGKARLHGAGCPSCGRRVVTEKNNLTVTHPELAAEYSLRNILPADKVMAGTNQKFWWTCGTCGNEYQAASRLRIKGYGKCARCNPRWKVHGKKRERSLAVCYPDLAIEYSPQNEVSADQIIAGTRRMLKWVCRSCGYVWEARGYLRIMGQKKCPVCAGRKV